MVVSRASHSHQVPHVGLPQSEPSDEREPGEHDADLGRRAREQIPGGVARARDQPQQRRERGDAEREVRDPRGRHVQVEQAHRVEALVRRAAA